MTSQYSTALIIILGLELFFVDGSSKKPISSKEAIRMIGKEVVVRFEVTASKNRLEKRGEIYLDSEEDFRDKNNLGVVITKKGAEQFKSRGIDDPAEHFLNKTIEVTGIVTSKEQRARIEVDEYKQIKLIEK